MTDVVGIAGSAGLIGSEAQCFCAALEQIFERYVERWV
jgi:hypothetical protein